MTLTKTWVVTILKLTERFFYTELLYGQRVALEWQKKVYVTRIRSESENNWPVKYKRFHIKKSITRQTITSPKSAPIVWKNLLLYLCYITCESLCLLGTVHVLYQSQHKRQKNKTERSIPLSLLLRLSKCKFSEIVMFMT